MASIKSLNQTGNPIANSATTENTNKPLEVDNPKQQLCVTKVLTTKTRQKYTKTDKWWREER